MSVEFLFNTERTIQGNEVGKILEDIQSWRDFRISVPSDKNITMTKEIDHLESPASPQEIVMIFGNNDIYVAFNTSTLSQMKDFIDHLSAILGKLDIKSTVEEI